MNQNSDSINDKSLLTDKVLIQRRLEQLSTAYHGLKVIRNTRLKAAIIGLSLFVALIVFLYQFELVKFPYLLHFSVLFCVIATWILLFAIKIDSDELLIIQRTIEQVKSKMEKMDLNSNDKAENL